MIPWLLKGFRFNVFKKFGNCSDTEKSEVYSMCSFEGLSNRNLFKYISSFFMIHFPLISNF
jgi:hypothetical protein